MGALDIILAGLRATLPNFARSDGEIESKIIDVVATYADSEVIERNNTLTTIQYALANQKITTKEYYRRKAVQFQINDTLVYDPINQGGYYDPVIPENQIIKQAYVIGQFPIWTILVNALDSTGRLRPLTGVELSSFTTYFEAFQPLGLVLNINSMEVAKITDAGMVVYVRPGTDSAVAAAQINANLLAHEAVLRNNNAVSITEIEDVIQQYPDVVAVGFNDPIATEVTISGETRVVRPVAGIFNLTSGAFSFRTEITVDNVKTLE